MADSEPPQLNPEGNAKKPIISAFENTRERISAYLSYQSLKVKEYSGKLNEDEFHKLLSIDFQDELRDNPPIEGVFSPEEELSKIKKLPAEQKKEALATFKDNLSRQRIALASCRVFVERSIEFNHDVSSDKLKGLVNEFSTHYGFDKNQIEITEKLIDMYYENRNRVLAVRKEYPDNHELVKILTGVELSKDQPIDISVGPVSIDIRTNGFNVGKLYGKLDGSGEASNRLDFASQSDAKVPIHFVVINQDKLMRLALLDPKGNSAVAHEHEHIENNLFRTVFDSYNLPTTLGDRYNEQDNETKKILLEDLLIQHRTVAFDRAKDEITASLQNIPLQIFQFSLSPIFFNQNNRHYDYLSYIRNWEHFKDDPLYQETSERLLVKEYRKIIEKSVSSFAELVYIGKYPTQEAIALLTDKPLEQWPKTVKRLLEQKEVS